MYKSFIEKKPVGMDTKSIASGLAPPFAGIIHTVFDSLPLLSSFSAISLIKNGKHFFLTIFTF